MTINGSNMDEVIRFNADRDQIENIQMRLFEFCKTENWAGFDPYDALNSRVLSPITFIDNRIINIAFTQIIKRLPINLRPFLLVSKEHNPKAIALFLMGFTKNSFISKCLQIERNAQRLYPV